MLQTTVVFYHLFSEIKNSSSYRIEMTETTAAVA